MKSVKATLFGMGLNASPATGVAWDNFDRFVETKSGKDTLHDIIGIALQVLDNQQPYILEDNQVRQNSNEKRKLKMRKRLYSSLDLTVTPYRRKPIFPAHGMLELNDVRRLKYEKTCDGISSPKKYDFLWMTDFTFNDNDTLPMWIGWNAKHSPQNKTTQKNMVPPTNQPVSNISISSGRDNEKNIEDSIRRSKRTYFRDLRSCFGKVSNENSS